MLFSIDFENIFILISLNILNIESKEDSDIDESEEFNIGIQIYLTFEEEHEEFIVIKVNLNIIRKDNEEYLYNEDDPYFELNNVEHHNIV